MSSDPRRGLYVTIYRRPGADCTNGGVTCPERAPKAEAILLGTPDGNFEEGHAQALYVPQLEIRTKKTGRFAVYVYAAPVGETRHVMFGGNFVYTSDSRYRDFVCDYPIPVHDRIEGK